MGTSTKSHTPSKVPTSVKRRPRGYAREGGLKRMFQPWTPSPFSLPTTPRWSNRRHYPPCICKKDEIDSQETLQGRGNGVRSDQRLQDTQEGDDITPAEVFWGRTLNFEKRRDSSAHPADEVLLSHTRRRERGSESQDRSLLARDRMHWKSDRSIQLKQESYISPNSGTLSQWLMRCNNVFMATNVMHL